MGLFIAFRCVRKQDGLNKFLPLQASLLDAEHPASMQAEISGSCTLDTLSQQAPAPSLSPSCWPVLLTLASGHIFCVVSPSLMQIEFRF